MLSSATVTAARWKNRLHHHHHHHHHYRCRLCTNDNTCGGCSSLLLLLLAAAAATVLLPLLQGTAAALSMVVAPRCGRSPSFPTTRRVMGLNHHCSSTITATTLRLTAITATTAVSGIDHDADASASAAGTAAAATLTAPNPPPKKVSKFASILAASEAAAATATVAYYATVSGSESSSSWPTVDFSVCHENSNTSSNHRIAVLPDDDCVIHPPPPLHNQRELHYVRSLLSPTEVSSLLASVVVTDKKNDALFQQRDSQCLVVIEDGECARNAEADDDDDLTTRILLPILHDKILPFARRVCGAPNMVVADASIRLYDASGDNDDNGDENDNVSQQQQQLLKRQKETALAVHYDVSSFCSVIVPLNPHECVGGLYVQWASATRTRLAVDVEQAGDAILHRFDVMHGVHVRQGKRYSLVVWLAESGQAVREKTAPWVPREAQESVHAAYLYASYAKDGLYGVPRDEGVARHHLEWAAARGHAISMHSLAVLLMKHQQHDDVGSEPETASNARIAELLARASDRGLAQAQHELGTAFKQGYFGLERDFDAARQQYDLAAAQGYRPSIEILGDASRWR